MNKHAVNRAHIAPVRLSERERAKLTELSRKSGLSREAVLRRLIMDKELHAKPPEAYIELVRQVSALGNNLNQIAHIANADRSVHQGQLNEANQIMREVWTLIKDTV